MQVRKPDDTAAAESRRLQQGEMSRAGNALSPSVDPLAPMITRISDAPPASVHAAMLNRVTGMQPSRAGNALLQLQRQYGNRYVQRVLALVRQADDEMQADPEVEKAIERARGGGQALDRGVRTQMESAFGADFSGVRVHTDAGADALNRALSAHAFTTGQDIFFREGEYKPGGSDSRELMAHELTHVLQQRQSSGGLQRGVTSPNDAVEQEATRVAKSIIHGDTLASQRKQEEELQMASQAEERDPLAYAPTDVLHDTGSNAAAGLFSLASQGPYHTPLILRQGSTEGRPRDPEFFNLSGVEAIRANMEQRFHQVASYSSVGLRAADIVKDKLLALSRQYSNAYGDYTTVIRRARQEAQNQERWINICVGIGAGILLGVGAAFILPSTAAGAFALTANEALVAAASAAGQATAGAFMGSGITGSLRPAGTDLEPGGLDPKVLELSIWRNVAEMYRSAVRLTEAGRNMHMLSNAAEYLIGQIRTYIAGGEVDMSEENMLDMMVTLVNADNAMLRYDAMLSEKLTAVMRLRETAAGMSLSGYPTRQMEQDIWILWMSELDDPSVLDLDEIEDYLHGPIEVLGSGSRLGVDFGGWTSADDEREARDAARRERRSILARLRRLEGGGLSIE